MNKRQQRQFNRSQQLYKAGQINKARNILARIDDPKAQRVLANINERHPPRRGISGRSAVWLIIIGLCGFIFFIIPSSDQNEAEPTSRVAAATATITDTPAPFIPTTDPIIANWQQQIETALLEIDGVDAIELVSVNTSGELPFVVVEAIVYPGTNNTAFADAYLQIVQQTLATARFSLVSMSVSDGIEAIDYMFDFETDEWRTNPLAVVTPPTPRPRISPTATQSASITPLSAQAVACPCNGDTLNCGDFQNTSAQACFEQCLAETGWDVHRLDRDGDGRACEN